MFQYMLKILFRTDSDVELPEDFGAFAFGMQL